MNNKKWILKTKEGREFGPLSYDQVAQLIEEAIIGDGDELRSEKGTLWLSTADIPEFYEETLKALQANLPPPTYTEKIEYLERMCGSNVRPLRAEVSSHAQTRSKTQPDDKTKHDEPATIMLDLSDEPDAKIEIETPKKLEPTVVAPNYFKNASVSRKRRIRFSRESILSTVFILIAAVAVLYLIFGDSSRDYEVVQLQVIKPHGKGLDSQTQEDLFKQSFQDFQQDNIASYLSAQSKLVKLVEAYPTNKEMMSLLCLTQREIWPFTKKTSRDYEAVAKLVRLISSVDPLGIDGAICRVTQQMIFKRYQEALGVTNNLLVEYPQVAALYDFKAEIVSSENPILAISYSQTAQQLWKTWKKPFVFEIYYRILANDGSGAQSKLSSNFTKKDHPDVFLLEGVLKTRFSDSIQEGSVLQQKALNTTPPPRPLFRVMSYLELAKIYQKSGETNKALGFAKIALRIEPSLNEARYMVANLGGSVDEVLGGEAENIILGDQYFNEGNYLSAQAHYKTAYESNKNTNTAVKIAKSLWELNQGREAIEWLEQAIEKDSKNIEALVTISKYLADRYEYNKSIQYLQKALKSNPKSYEVYRGFSYMEFKRNNFKAAESYAQKALSFYSADIESHMLIVKSFLAMSNVSEAYNWAARMLELDRSNVEALGVYAKALSSYQGVSSGIDFMMELVNTYPKTWRHKLHLAEIYIADAKYSAAIDVLTKLVNENGSRKEAHLLLGEAAQKIGRRDEALSSFLSAATLDPSDPDPIFSMGMLYLEEKKPEPAIQNFDRVLRITPQFPGAHYAIGKAALLMGDNKRALEEAAMEKKINPNTAAPYLLAGETYMYNKQYSRATQEFQAALKLRPNSADLYVKLAKSYRLSGQLDTALSMLRTAESKESGYAEIYKEFGAVYEMKGDIATALGFYNKYLEVDPRAPDRSAVEQRIQALGGGT